MGGDKIRDIYLPYKLKRGKPNFWSLIFILAIFIHLQCNTLCSTTLLRAFVFWSYNWWESNDSTDLTEADGSAGWRLRQKGISPRQLTPMSPNFKLWVKFQSGHDGGTRALAPNRTATLEEEQHGHTSDALLGFCSSEKNCSCFTPKKAPTYPILKHFFMTGGKKKL